MATKSKSKTKSKSHPRKYKSKIGLAILALLGLSAGLINHRHTFVNKFNQDDLLKITKAFQKQDTPEGLEYARYIGQRYLQKQYGLNHKLEKLPNLNFLTQAQKEDLVLDEELHYIREFGKVSRWEAHNIMYDARKRYGLPFITADERLIQTAKKIKKENSRKDRIHERKKLIEPYYPFTGLYDYKGTPWLDSVLGFY